jgi:hypothetical protein
MKSSTRFALTLVIASGLSVALACARSAAPTAPPAPTLAASADGISLNVGAPTVISPLNSIQVSGTPTLTVAAITAPAGTTLSYQFEVLTESGTRVELSPVVASTSYTLTTVLEATRIYAWRARAALEGRVGPWSSSSTARFTSSAGGYILNGEVKDLLTNGQTVGERFGTTTFLGSQGLRLDNETSYVRYQIPGSVTSGEFSVEISGLRANNSGDKSKVFAMSSNNGDFLLDPFRIDVQYRGTAGSPPNAIQFRALYGSESDLSVRYEPDTAARFASVVSLDPNTVYFWKLTWGSAVRLVVRAGGVNGTVIYDRSVNAPNGTYNPSPWYAYLGAPIGQAFAESGTTPGAIYKNVWISSRPRP